MKEIAQELLGSHWLDADDVMPSMVGRTMVSAKGEKGDDEISFVSSDGYVFKFFHEQDCCEHVRVEDIDGDLTDLLNNPITLAEVATSADSRPDEWSESWTWTFYKFATVKASITVRWLGESNGYYSESVQAMVRRVVEDEG